MNKQGARNNPLMQFGSPNVEEWETVIRRFVSVGCFEELEIYAKRDELPVLCEAINEVQCGAIVYHGTDKICEKLVNMVRARMLDVFSRLPPTFPIVLLACGQKAPAEEFILHLSTVSTKAHEAGLSFNYAVM